MSHDYPILEEVGTPLRASHPAYLTCTDSLAERASSGAEAIGFRSAVL